MGSGQSGKGLSEAALVAATGVSPRKLIRLRQDGFIQILEGRHGRGQGGGTTPIEYAPSAVAAINRYNELSRTERRWRMWLEDYPVRIAPDLAKTFDRISAARQQISTLSDIERMIPGSLLKSASDLALQTIFRGLGDNDLQSLATLLVCVCLGIKLPLFDEPNPKEFQVFKYAFGLPAYWQLPPGLFDVFPYLYDQLRKAKDRHKAAGLRWHREPATDGLAYQHETSRTRIWHIPRHCGDRYPNLSRTGSKQASRVRQKQRLTIPNNG